MMTEAITLPTRAATAITPSERHGSACSSRKPAVTSPGAFPEEPGEPAMSVERAEEGNTSGASPERAEASQNQRPQETRGRKTTTTWAATTKGVAT